MYLSGHRKEKNKVTLQIAKKQKSCVKHKYEKFWHHPTNPEKNQIKEALDYISGFLLKKLIKIIED